MIHRLVVRLLVLLLSCTPLVQTLLPAKEVPSDEQPVLRSPIIPDNPSCAIKNAFSSLDAHYPNAVIPSSSALHCRKRSYILLICYGN